MSSQGKHDLKFWKIWTYSKAAGPSHMLTIYTKVQVYGRRLGLVIHFIVELSSLKKYIYKDREGKGVSSKHLLQCEWLQGKGSAFEPIALQQPCLAGALWSRPPESRPDLSCWAPSCWHGFWFLNPAILQRTISENNDLSFNWVLHLNCYMFITVTWLLVFDEALVDLYKLYPRWTIETHRRSLENRLGTWCSSPGVGQIRVPHGREEW